MRFNARAVVLGLLLLLLAGGAVFAGLRFFGSDAEKVLYQDPEDIGPDPFTDPAVLVADVTESTTTTLAVTPAPTPTGTATTLTTAPIAQGPFGGTGKKGDCDPELLIRFLNDNPDKKEAWVEVLGIELEDFETYVRSLRKTILIRDARITNHGFKDGEAYGFQAILASGTAVLVDEEGEIVVRCYCGNPLQPPAPLEDYECDGCPDDYDPPGACNRTCYPELTTTTTTLPVTTTIPETTTTRRVTTTRRPTTTRPTTTTIRVTQPTTTTVIITTPTTTTTRPPTTTSTTQTTTSTTQPGDGTTSTTGTGIN